MGADQPDRARRPPPAPPSKPAPPTTEELVRIINTAWHDLDYGRMVDRSHHRRPARGAVRAIGILRPTIPSLLADLPGVRPIDRGTMDAWDDPALRRAIQATGRRRLVIGGLYSEICVAYPTVRTSRPWPG